jgi:hypothetical protein
VQRQRRTQFKIMHACQLPPVRSTGGHEQGVRT